MLELQAIKSLRSNSEINLSTPVSVELADCGLDFLHVELRGWLDANGRISILQ